MPTGLNFHMETYHLVMILFAIVAGFWAMFYALAKVIGKLINDKFQSISDHLKRQDERLSALESQFNELRVEIARDYVHRDDYVRDIGSLGTQFQALAINVERMFGNATRETLKMIQAEMRK